MKRNGRLKLLPTLIISVFIITLFAGGVALAQSGYNLRQGTVPGGGHIAGTGGDYSLGGSIGQPFVGVMSSGNDYTLGSGFWGGGDVQSDSSNYRTYLPITLKY